MANLGEVYRKKKAFYKGPKSRRRPAHLRHWEKLRGIQIWVWGREWREQEGRAGLWAEDPGKRNTVITL